MKTHTKISQKLCHSFFPSGKTISQKSSKVLLTLVVLATAEFPEGIRAAIPKGLPLKIVSQGVPFAQSVKGKKLQSTRLMGGLIPATHNQDEHKKVQAVECQAGSEQRKKPSRG